MSKEREELNKKKAERKKSNLKSNLAKAGSIIASIAIVIWTAKSKSKKS